MGPGGSGPSLGGSSFTVTADTAAFTHGLDQAQQQAKQFHNTVATSMSAASGAVSSGSRDAAQGLLFLGQAVDDLQYGFRAIVNNIPQIVMALGGSAGLAGAVAIAAVAVNQFVNNWESLQDVLFNTQGLDRAKTQLETIADLLERGAAGSAPGGPLGAFAAVARMFQGGEEIGAQKAAALAADAERANLGNQAAKSAMSQEEKERAKLFGQALGEYGGDRLRTEMIAKAIDGRDLTPGQVRAIEQQVDARIGQAVRGRVAGATMGGEFGGGFAAVFDRFARDAETARLNKAGAENERDTAGLKDNWNKILGDEGAENERRMVAQLQGEKKEIQARLDAERDRMAAMKPAEMFGSMREYLSQVTVKGADNVRKQQLDVQKGMKAELQKVNQKLDKIAGARFQ